MLTVGEHERNLLAQIIIEARNSFEDPMDDPYTERLIRKSYTPFGSEQLIKIYLEQFLIQFLRNFSGKAMFSDNQSAKTGRPAIYDDDAVFNDIMAYLDKNICQASYGGKDQPR